MILLSPHHSAPESQRALLIALFCFVFLQKVICLLICRVARFPQVIFGKSCICMSSTQGSIQNHHVSICQSLVSQTLELYPRKTEKHSLLLYEICRRLLWVTMLFCISTDAEKQILSCSASLRRCATLITVYGGALPTHNITS